jgi:hypothetical protein
MKKQSILKKRALESLFQLEIDDNNEEQLKKTKEKVIEVNDNPKEDYVVNGHIVHLIDDSHPTKFSNEDEEVMELFLYLTKKAHEADNCAIMNQCYSQPMFLIELAWEYVGKHHKDKKTLQKKEDFQAYMKRKVNLLDKNAGLLSYLFHSEYNKEEKQIEYRFGLNHHAIALCHRHGCNDGLVVHKGGFNSNIGFASDQNQLSKVLTDIIKRAAVEMTKANIQLKEKPRFTDLLIFKPCSVKNANVNIDFNFRWAHSQFRPRSLPEIKSSFMPTDFGKKLTDSEKTFFLHVSMRYRQSNVIRNKHTDETELRKKLLVHAKIFRHYQYVAWMIDQFVTNYLTEEWYKDSTSNQKLLRCLLHIEAHAWYYAGAAAAIAGDHHAAVYCYRFADRGFKRHYTLDGPLYLEFLIEFIYVTLYSIRYADLSEKLIEFLKEIFKTNNKNTNYKNKATELVSKFEAQLRFNKSLRNMVVAKEKFIMLKHVNKICNSK